MSKKKKGFTLIELLIVISIVGIIAALIITTCGSGSGSAQDEADSFIQRHNIDAQADCVGYDTDRDGYVSCPFVYSDGGIKGMECSYWGNGCREPKASMGW